MDAFIILSHKLQHKNATIMNGVSYKGNIPRSQGVLYYVHNDLILFYTTIWNIDSINIYVKESLILCLIYPDMSKYLFVILVYIAAENVYVCVWERERERDRVIFRCNSSHVLHILQTIIRSFYIYLYNIISGYPQIFFFKLFWRIFIIFPA